MTMVDVEPAALPSHVVVQVAPTMPGWERIGWGCLGALVAMLTSFVAQDMSALRAGWQDVDTVAIELYTAKYLILLLMGGLVALIKTDETDRVNLLALGAAAPTVLVTLFNSQAAVVGP